MRTILLALALIACSLETAHAQFYGSTPMQRFEAQQRDQMERNQQESEKRMRQEMDQRMDEQRRDASMRENLRNMAPARHY